MAGRYTCMQQTLWTVALLVLLAVHVDSKNSYLFVAPNVVRPGRPFTIQGEQLEEPGSPVVITAELTGDGLVASTKTTVNGKQNVNLDLAIPTDVKPSKSFSLTVKGTGGLTFSNKKSLTYEEKSTSVSIQTDKAVYKPGQTVNFRVFGVTPELKIIYDKLKVELFDPKGNKINQWDVSGFELTNLGGVYVQHQVMSAFPELGTWKLKAKLLSYGDSFWSIPSLSDDVEIALLKCIYARQDGRTPYAAESVQQTKFEEKTFRVEEYVLPRYEVELDLPTFGKTTDTQFHGKVIAKYTFGKPVKGEVSLRIKPKRERFQWTKNQRVSISKTIEKKFRINGNAPFSLPMSQLKEIERSLSGSSLIFEANVTESLTSSVQSDSQEVTFYSKTIKLEFPKSLPETFKPGMTYNDVVKVAQQDGTPPDVVNGQLKVTVTEYRIIKLHPVLRELQKIFPRDWWGPSPPRPRETIKQLPPTHHTIPPDGIVQFPVEVNDKVVKISVKAEYDGVSSSQTLKKRHSPSETFIQLTMSSKSAQAGQDVSLDIKSTTSPGRVNYQIYSKGSLVETGQVDMSTKTEIWSPLMTAAMAPRARIVVYFVRTDGEVVADALTLNVEGVFENKVSISFNNTSAAPAKKIRLDVTADVGSTVNILGVDKSVLLMGTGNDISKSQVLQELQFYDNKPTKRRHDFPICDWFCWRWPVSSGGADVKDVFEDAGVVVLTDALIYDHIEPTIIDPRFKRPMFPSGRGRGVMMNRIQVRPTQPMANSAPRMASSFKATLPKDLAPVKRTRKLFPETWLWTSAKIQSSGKASIEEIVPDTITSWIATAFAINPTTGLGLSENGAQLQVTLPFFISVNLPYSVIRGEKVVIQVNIHNYSPTHMITFVELSQSLDYDVILINGASQSRASTNVQRTITVAPDEIVAVYFPIIPTKIGRVDVNIKAQSSAMSDAVNKKLLVEAEGSPVEYNLPVVLDLKQRGTLVKMAKVEFPPRIVSGSERVVATVIGDLMGPSISGLDKLLKMPYGCGEQNMLNFAPNIFIVKYMEATKNLDDVILKKATEFMETGYQRELTYAHKDGSFSAFGNRDTSGSMWLTAFVLKSFVQAKPYIFVDDKVIIKAIDWILKHQNADGTFNEPGRILHKEMQGGSTEGKTSLTAFVLIALLEARVVEEVATKISGSQLKAQTYLEGEIYNITDVYELAIVGYSLQLATSSNAALIWQKLPVRSFYISLIWQKLDAKAKVEAGTKYWEREPKVATKISKPWEKRNGVAIDIELTAYALLTLANKNDRINGVQVLKWLTEQRNPSGGFSSTQDTVLALQALADMAALIYSPVYDMSVSVVGTGYSNTFTINNPNALVLQSREIPRDVGELTITATGQGLALVQIGVSYNIDNDDQKQSFFLKITLSRETINGFDVHACASWLENGTSSMAVIEIGSPSGFVAESSNVVSIPPQSRAEVESKKIILYFDEIGSKDTCVTVTMQRVQLVAGVQPVPVKVYDYYEPTKQATEFYLPESLRTSDVCGVCGTECNFCKKP